MVTIYTYTKKSSFLRITEEFLRFCLQTGGFIARKKLSCPNSTIQSLIAEQRLLQIKLYSFRNIVKPEYYGKSFLCDSKTSAVRLLQLALKPITRETRQVRCLLNKFPLSEAEKCAIFWKLGRHAWKPTDTKSTIQIDGVFKGFRVPRVLNGEA
jgi:hypothetical protein